MGKNPQGDSEKSPWEYFPVGFLTFVVEYFLVVIIDFKPKTYRISSVWSILLEISHFRCLCQLKVLDHFAKKLILQKNSNGS